MWNYLLENAALMSGAAVTVVVQTALVLGMGWAVSRLVSKGRSARGAWVLQMTLVGVLAVPCVMVGYRLGDVSMVYLADLSLENKTGGVLESAKPATDLSPAATPEVVSSVAAADVTVGASVDRSVVSRGRLKGKDGAVDESGMAVDLVVEDELSVIAALWESRGVVGLKGFVMGGGWVLIWGAVSLLMLGRLGLTHVRIGRVRKAAVVADDATVAKCAAIAARMGIGAPGVLVSDAVKSPCLTGVIRPVILLPASDGDVSSQVLVHELGHLARRDCFWALTGSVVKAMLFFNPLVWLIARDQHRLADDVCDDFVVKQMEGRSDYASLLVDLAERYVRVGAEAEAGLGVVKYKSSLKRRVARILDEGREVVTVVGKVPGGLIAAGAVVVTLGCGLVVAEQEKKAEAAVGDVVTKVTVHGVAVTEKGYPRPGVYFYAFNRPVKSSPYTNADGQFTLTDVNMGDRIWIVKPHHQPGRMGLMMLPEADFDKPIEARIDMNRASMSGRLVDRNGHGVGNERRVKLRLHLPDGRSVVSAPMRSDKTGKYGFYYLPAAAGYAFEVGLIEEAGEEITWKHRHEMSIDDLQLTVPDFVDEAAEFTGGKVAESSIEVLHKGRVVNEEGKAVAGARVELNWAKFNGRIIMMAGRNGRTDEEGYFKIMAPRETPEIRMKLAHPDYIDSNMFRGEVKSYATPGRERLLDGTALVVMQRGESVRGVVRDQQGAPIADALVMGTHYISQFNGYPREDTSMARSDEAGRFVIRGLLNIEGKLTVYARGYAPARPVMEAGELEIVMEEGVTRSGRVIDREGNPVSGVTVTLDKWELDDNLPLNREDMTDEAGRFMLKHMPQAGEFNLRRRKEGYDRNSASGIVFGGAPVEITIYKPMKLDGFVVDAMTGAAVEQFKMVRGWSSAKDEEELYYPAGTAKTVKSSEGVFSYETTYAMIPKDQNDVPMRFSAPGYKTMDAALVLGNESGEAQRIELESEAGLLGVVQAPDGTLAKGARMGLVKKDRGLLIRNGLSFSVPDSNTNTDASGQFRLQSMPYAGSIVALHESGYGVWPTEGYDATAPLKLTGWSRIEGVLLNEKGEGVHNQIVRIEWDRNAAAVKGLTWSFDETTTHTDGTFAFQRVPIQTTQLITGEEKVTVKPKAGETHTVQIGDTGKQVD